MRVRARSAPRVAAVTVTYNSAAVLDDFLDSAFAQQGSWRLVIVDNDSTDGTRERLGQIDDPRVDVILADTNGGFAVGSNIGIRHALAIGAERILLINNDTVFDPHVWQALDRKMTETGVDAVSPVILSTDPVRDGSKGRIWYAGGTLELSRGIRNVHDKIGWDVEEAPSDDFETEFCPACCMMIDRALFERVGLLSEDYFVYGEDTDFAWRINRAGARVLVTPSLRILHKESALTGGDRSPFTVRQKAIGRLLFERQHRSWLAAGVTAVHIAASSLMRLARREDSVQLALTRVRAISAGFRQPIGPYPTC